MGRRKKTTARMDLSPENLRSLDQEALIALVQRLLEQNSHLSEQIRNLIQEKYGRKTEKFDDPNQLRLLSDEQTQPPAEAVQPIESPKPKRPGHGRSPFPSHLTRQSIEREPRSDEKTCSCGRERVNINKVVRNRRYEIIPASICVEEITENIWRCPGCSSTIVVAPDACDPIPNGAAGPRLLVDIAVDRFLNHLPYHRQEQIFFRQGIPIVRSTMCGWVRSLAAIFRPVYEAMRAELLESKVIATDDTPVKVQDRTKKKNIKRGHEWIFMGDETHPVNVFHYTQGRGRAGPKEFLPGFKEYLQGDCFSGNRALCAETGATFVACRAHDRRQYKKAMPNDQRRCTEMLDMYRDLFEIESTAREFQLSPEDTVQMRKEESVPILDKMKLWLDEQSIMALPQSSLGKAVGYSLNNWVALNNFLKDGNLRIDNNLAEQQMKMVAIGRKNWYFFGSDEAGETASILLSVLSTCLRHEVEPSKYMYEALLRLVSNPSGDARDLLPYVWKQNSVMGEMTMSTIPQKQGCTADKS